jgi:hypothetical protein
MGLKIKLINTNTLINVNNLLLINMMNKLIQLAPYSVSLMSWDLYIRVILGLKNPLHGAYLIAQPDGCDMHTRLAS